MSEKTQNKGVLTRLTDAESASSALSKRIETLENFVKESALAYELCQVALDFETMALEATGGDYATGYPHPLTMQKVYDNTFKKLAKDYRRKKMDKESLERLEAFLSKIAPEWAGTPQDLVNRLDATITDMKGVLYSSE